jgi:hypothetical protein
MATSIGGRCRLSWFYQRIGLVVLVVGLLANGMPAQPFESGSNGSDGALNLTTPGTIVLDPRSFNPPLDTDGDNVYHFTTINIAAGVTVRLSGQIINGPVIWLATGAVKVDGTLDLNGENGHPRTLNPALRKPSTPGAGGYRGGAGGNIQHPPQPGSGPGGGATGTPTDGSGFNGSFTGNQFLVPLIGGSGGGGATEAEQQTYGIGGAAGGGAILIASSTSVEITGRILANGGSSACGGCGPFTCGGCGGGGSGGAIRLVTPLVSGTGSLSAGGGSGRYGAATSPGLVRIEAFQQNFTGGISQPFNLASPSNVYPSAVPATVRVVTVDGISVAQNPTGTFEMPDITINKSGLVSVVIEARNVPPGTVVKLHILSENGPDITVDSTPLVLVDGTLSSATAEVTFPPGFSRGFVRASWTQ